MQVTNHDHELRVVWWAKPGREVGTPPRHDLKRTYVDLLGCQCRVGTVAKLSVRDRLEGGRGTLGLKEQQGDSSGLHKGSDSLVTNKEPSRVTGGRLNAWDRGRDAGIPSGKPCNRAEPNPARSPWTGSPVRSGFLGGVGRVAPRTELVADSAQQWETEENDELSAETTCHRGRPLCELAWEVLGLGFSEADQDVGRRRKQFLPTPEGDNLSPRFVGSMTKHTDSPQFAHSASGTRHRYRAFQKSKTNFIAADAFLIKANLEIRCFKTETTCMEQVQIRLVKPK